MKIAVALSGGGARCLAQLGYLEVLQEQFSIEIAALSGSSGGAIVAALLAKGATPQEALATIKEFDFSKIRLNLFGGSLFLLEPLIEELHHLGLGDFSELRLPLFVTLTTYDGKKSIYCNKGDVARTIVASASLLPLFAPTQIEGRRYIDGAFSDNLPVTPLREFEHFILAINVNPLDASSFPNTLWGNFKRAAYLMLNANIRSSIPKAHKYTEIAGCQNFGILERKSFDAIYALGKKQAEKELQEWEQIYIKSCLIKSSQ